MHLKVMSILKTYVNYPNTSVILKSNFYNVSFHFLQWNIKTYLLRQIIIGGKAY